MLSSSNSTLINKHSSSMNVSHLLSEREVITIFVLAQDRAYMLRLGNLNFGLPPILLMITVLLHPCNVIPDAPLRRR